MRIHIDPELMTVVKRSDARTSNSLRANVKRYLAGEREPLQAVIDNLLRRALLGEDITGLLGEKRRGRNEPSNAEIAAIAIEHFRQVRRLMAEGATYTDAQREATTQMSRYLDERGVEGDNKKRVQRAVSDGRVWRYGPDGWTLVDPWTVVRIYEADLAAHNERKKIPGQEQPRVTREHF